MEIKDSYPPGTVAVADDPKWYKTYVVDINLAKQVGYILKYDLDKRMMTVKNPDDLKTEEIYVPDTRLLSSEDFDKHFGIKEPKDGTRNA